MSCDCEKSLIIIVRDGMIPVTWCYKCGTLYAYNIWKPVVSHADKCLHKDSARKRGARWEWCEDCGAVRLHKARKPQTRWQRPGGAYGENPGSLRPLVPKRKPREDDA